jgi:serine/threonine-protein phosphatase 6 regulatory ankyrin repeat subunit A
VLNLLISSGASINDQPRNGATPLSEATFHNTNPEICKILLSAGSAINQRNSAGWTPLTSAAAGNTNPEVIKLLLDNHADPNIRDMSGKSAYDYILTNPNLKSSDVAKTLSQAQ